MGTQDQMDSRQANGTQAADKHFERSIYTIQISYGSGQNYLLARQPRSTTGKVHLMPQGSSHGSCGWSSGLYNTQAITFYRVDQAIEMAEAVKAGLWPGDAICRKCLKHHPNWASQQITVIEVESQYGGGIGWTRETEAIVVWPVAKAEDDQKQREFAQAVDDFLNPKPTLEDAARELGIDLTPEPKPGTYYTAQKGRVHARVSGVVDGFVEYIVRTPEVPEWTAVRKDAGHTVEVFWSLGFVDADSVFTKGQTVYWIAGQPVTIEGRSTRLGKWIVRTSDGYRSEAWEENLTTEAPEPDPASVGKGWIIDYQTYNSDRTVGVIVGVDDGEAALSTWLRTNGMKVKGTVYETTPDHYAAQIAGRTGTFFCRAARPAKTVEVDTIVKGYTSRGKLRDHYLPVIWDGQQNRVTRIQQMPAGDFLPHAFMVNLTMLGGWMASPQNLPVAHDDDDEHDVVECADCREDMNTRTQTQKRDDGSPICDRCATQRAVDDLPDPDSPKTQHATVQNAPGWKTPELKAISAVQAAQRVVNYIDATAWRAHYESMVIGGREYAGDHPVIWNAQECRQHGYTADAMIVWEGGPFEWTQTLTGWVDVYAVCAIPTYVSVEPYSGCLLAFYTNEGERHQFKAMQKRDRQNLRDHGTSFPQPAGDQLSPTPFADDPGAADQKRADDAKANLDRIERSLIDGEQELSDCFVSRFASGLTQREAELNAQLKRDGGVAAFPALFDLATGKIVKTRVIDGQWGQRWMVYREDGGRDFLPYHGRGTSKKIAANLAKKGYQIGIVMAPAHGEIVGSGTGLSGLSTCHVMTVKDDENAFDPTVVFDAELAAKHLHDRDAQRDRDREREQQANDRKDDAMGTQDDSTKTISGSDLAGSAASDEDRAILARNVAKIEAETEAKRAATCPACGSTDPANAKPWHYFSEDARAEISGITCRACGAHFEVGPDGSQQIDALPPQVQQERDDRPNRWAGKTVEAAYPQNAPDDLDAKQVRQHCEAIMVAVPSDARGKWAGRSGILMFCPLGDPQPKTNLTGRYFHVVAEDDASPISALYDRLPDAQWPFTTVPISSQTFAGYAATWTDLPVVSRREDRMAAC